MLREWIISVHLDHQLHFFSASSTRLERVIHGSRRFLVKLSGGILTLNIFTSVVHFNDFYSKKSGSNYALVLENRPK